jgi:hypothetical protein
LLFLRRELLALGAARGGAGAELEWECTRQTE